jgi:tRNA threonylcarbamoyladenosine biosynthesis protein TsaE
MKVISKSVEETKEVAKKFLEGIELRRGGAAIVGLFGDLGAGKTAFTKCVAEILGVSESVTSPTFVIEKIYTLDGQKFKRLIHIDAYRLEKGEELIKIGWREISEDENNLILIEWPEKVTEILPENMIKINFTFIDENTREISY